MKVQMARLANEMKVRYDSGYIHLKSEKANIKKNRARAMLRFRI